ncbi:MAG: tetratricopeptide repeat protein [Planctomycetota bacterium]|nr:tetratricopeptide repeat protein [Planctomycetota bacterium]
MTQQVSVKEAFDIALGHHQAGRLTDAEAIYRNILSQDPNFADAVHLLGVLAHQVGQTQQAHDLIWRAIGLKPMSGEYYSNLGLVLAKQGKHNQAIAAYKKAARLSPTFAAAHYNVGSALANAGEVREAREALLRAVALNPDFPDAHYTLGNIFLHDGEYPLAFAAYRKAIELRPTHSESYNNLGAALRLSGRPEEAFVCFENALRLQPKFAEAYNNYANALKDVGRVDEALSFFSKSLSISPNNAATASNRIYTLLFHPAQDGASLRREHQAWSYQFAQPLKSEILPLGNNPSPTRPLKIGYVSPDFCDHVVGRNILPLLRQHDHDQFEIYCYSSVSRPDQTTERFESYADHWRPLNGVADERAAEMIRGDGIDILIDLSQHMARNRLLIFARKPAPVQVAFGGYPGGTGLETMDYRLSDPYLDPPEFDSHYVEKTFRLADSFWCYDPAAMGLVDGPLVNELPALKNKFVTFGCFHNFCKVNDAVLKRWAMVLAAVPDSHLMLMVPEGRARQIVTKKIKASGIEAERLQFVTRQSHEDYFRLYHKIDIGLDTLPYNGHTTSLDSIWMGVPVVTLLGRTVVGRAGWSQMCNLKLKRLAVQTADRYVQIAVELSRDLPRLTEMRRALRPRMLESPLVDAKKFARNIEAAYRQMWQTWCAQIT